MQMVKRSGTDGLYWYLRFNGFFTEDDISNTEDDIIKNDFDGVSSLFFHKSTFVRTDFKV
jgi:hypothetical protein